MRHDRFPRMQTREITADRIRRSERVLARERAALPLFTQSVAADQDSPVERLARLDAAEVAHWQRMRDYHAKVWRRSRQRLRVLGPLGDAIRAAWQASSVPAGSEYLADMIHCRLRAEAGDDYHARPVA